MSLPPDRPENTHDRLNREISRMRSRSIGFWGGWTLLIGIVGIYAALSLAPKRIDYLWAEVTGVTQLSSETGPDHVIGVLVDGAPQTARSPARLIHPLPGDTICLTRTIRGGPLGGVIYTTAPDTLCRPSRISPGAE